MTSIYVKTWSIQHRINTTYEYQGKHIYKGEGVTLKTPKTSQLPERGYRNDQFQV